MAFQGDSIYWVEVDRIVPNPFQPRREFDQHKLQELADSIRMYGVLQPLTVTRKEIQREDGTFYSEYELIAGERRLRASKLAGVAQVPVIIREGEQSEQEKLELAIIENLQREDLNAIDRAVAFRQLADTFGLPHTQIAEKVGRSREYVSNSIRLLALPEHMQSALKQAELSEGHARALLMLSDRKEEQEVIFRETLLKKLSVREVERIVRKIATDKVRKKDPQFDPQILEFERKFTETLGTRVQIQKTDFGGKLTIDYFSEEDLAIILSRIKDESIEQRSGYEEIVKLATHTPLVLEETPAPVHVENDIVDVEQVQPEAVPQPIATVPVVSVNEQLRAQLAAITDSSLDRVELTVTPTMSAVEPTLEMKRAIPTSQAEQVDQMRARLAVERPDVYDLINQSPHTPPQIIYDVPIPPTPEPPAESNPILSEEGVVSVTPKAPVTDVPENLPIIQKPPYTADDESDLYSIRNFNV